MEQAAKEAIERLRLQLDLSQNETSSLQVKVAARLFAVAKRLLKL